MRIRCLPVSLKLTLANSEGLPDPIEMRDGVSLRPACVEDLEAILAIEGKVHTRPWNREHFQKELEKEYSQFLVATDDASDEKIYGYVVYWLQEDEAQILNLAVALEMRGLGLGQALLQQVVRDALQSGARRIWLELRKSNQAALGLYQKSRYYITQVRKGLYSDGEDGYVMELDLSDASHFNF